MQALWVKLYVDILGDPKLMRAARKGAKSLVYLPWLIVFAKSQDDDGRLTVSGDAAEAHDIASLIPAGKVKDVEAAIAALQEIGVLVDDGDGILRFASWSARQDPRPGNAPSAHAQRQKRYRDRKRQQREAGSADPVTRDARRSERDITGDVTRDAAAPSRDATEVEGRGKTAEIEQRERKDAASPVIPIATPARPRSSNGSSRNERNRDVLSSSVERRANAH